MLCSLEYHMMDKSKKKVIASSFMLSYILQKKIQEANKTF